MILQFGVTKGQGRRMLKVLMEADPPPDSGFGVKEQTMPEYQVGWALRTTLF